MEGFKKRVTLVRFAWLTLLFNLFVIIWGGFVSASGSGDGCGVSWPLCQQLVASETRTWQTVVEFSHRLTSGLALLMIILLVGWIFRTYPAKHLVRQTAVWSGIFIFIESLLGAALVLFQWVDTNLSLARAIVQPIHLFNTYLLMGALALTAWWASSLPKSPGQHLINPANKSLLRLLGYGLLGIVLVSTFGTIASLASTIFPSESFLEGVQKDLDREVHYLIRLRLWHPILAVVVGRYLFSMGNKFKIWFPKQVTIHQAVHSLWALYGLQFLLGSLNAIMLAPIWLQLIHLLMAHFIWFSIVTLGALTISGEGLLIQKRLLFSKPIPAAE